jgi:hypothetical protein
MTKWNSRVLLGGVLALLAMEVLAARDFVTVDLNKTIKPHCYVLQFPTGWQHSRDFADWVYWFTHYEFRSDPNNNAIFLVRVVSSFLIDTEKGRLPPSDFYTRNLYKVVLGDRAVTPQPANEKEWELAIPIISRPQPTSAESVTFSKGIGTKFPIGGDPTKYPQGLLSPNRAIFALQSWRGKLVTTYVPTERSQYLLFGNRGTLFFDFFSTAASKKVLTVKARFRTILPESVFRTTGWVTDRFFTVPLDDRRTRCLVCDFAQIGM